MAATIGAAAAIVRLAPGDGAHPAVMIVRPGHAPVQWHGWELIPPAESGAFVHHDEPDIPAPGECTWWTVDTSDT